MTLFITWYRFHVQAKIDFHVLLQVEHEDAVVMLLDIVEYTRSCSELSVSEVPYGSDFFFWEFPARLFRRLPSLESLVHSTQRLCFI
jgi:hypothetical protein